MIKEIKVTGSWDGESIVREEFPEEKLLRELKSGGLRDIKRIEFIEIVTEEDLKHKYSDTCHCYLCNDARELSSSDDYDLRTANIV